MIINIAAMGRGIKKACHTKLAIIPFSGNWCELPVSLRELGVNPRLLRRAMNESEFNEQIDEIFYALELRLDEIDSDFDYESGGGVLTVVFDTGSTMVFSRQPPTKQLWLATRAGGFHFEFDEAAGDWRNTRDQSLFRPFVVAQMKEQGGIEFSWD